MAMALAMAMAFAKAMAIAMAITMAMALAKAMAIAMAMTIAMASAKQVAPLSQGLLRTGATCLALSKPHRLTLFLKPGESRRVSPESLCHWHSFCERLRPALHNPHRLGGLTLPTH